MPRRMLQGFTVTVEPDARRWPAGNDEFATTKMHEPNVVAPVATLVPEEIENAGVEAVDVNATVVAAVVPRSGTPDGNENGTFVTAVAVLDVTGIVASTAATVGSGSSSPSLQAGRKAAAASIIIIPTSFFISTSPFVDEEIAHIEVPITHASRIQEISLLAQLLRLRPL